MAKPNEPHFSYPFRFGSGADKHALVNEQGTDEDIIDCVIAICKTPTGFRLDLPDFGVPELLFDEMPLRIDDVETALEKWEERASYRVTTEPHFRERLSAILSIYVRNNTDA